MAESTMTELVRRRLRQLKEDRRLSYTTLADRLALDASGISKTVAAGSTRPITVRLLEAVAELTQIPVAELVADPKRTLRELTTDEEVVIRSLRLWPASVSRALCGFVRFFAEDRSGDAQTRNLLELWRGLEKSADRDWLYGVAVLLREKTLAPDLRAGLEHRLKAEANEQPRLPRTKKE